MLRRDAHKCQWWVRQDFLFCHWFLCVSSVGNFIVFSHPLKAFPAPRALRLKRTIKNTPRQVLRDAALTPEHPRGWQVTVGLMWGRLFPLTLLNVEKKFVLKKIHPSPHNSDFSSKSQYWWMGVNLCDWGMNKLPGIYLLYQHTILPVEGLLCGWKWNRWWIYIKSSVFYQNFSPSSIHHSVLYRKVVWKAFLFYGYPFSRFYTQINDHNSFFALSQTLRFITANGKFKLRMNL